MSEAGLPSLPEASASVPAGKPRRGLRANGTTSLDRTNYFAKFSASDDNLQWYLGWLADAMVTP